MISSKVSGHLMPVHWTCSCGEETPPSSQCQYMTRILKTQLSFLLISHLLYNRFNNDLRMVKSLWRYQSTKQFISLVTHNKTGDKRQNAFSNCVFSAETPNPEEFHLTFCNCFVLFHFLDYLWKTDSLKYLASHCNTENT